MARLYRTIATAPEISSRRMYLSPRFLMPLNTFFIPLVFWRINDRWEETERSAPGEWLLYRGQERARQFQEG